MIQRITQPPQLNKLPAVADDRLIQYVELIHGRQSGTYIAEEGVKLIAHTAANIFTYVCLGHQYVKRTDDTGRNLFFTFVV